MKLGLHAHSLLLACGLREFRPVGRGALSAEHLLDKAAHLKCTAVQLARQQVVELDMVGLANLGQHAKDAGLLVHLSTNELSGEHLRDMIHRAHTMGAPQVTVGLARLEGNVQQRQRRLEAVLLDLEVAIKTAERYGVTLAIENGHHTAAADMVALVQAAQSERVRACYDMGNALTVPENPVESAALLAPYCVSIHLKDFQVYRSDDGAVLVNCPIGAGVVPVVEALRVFSARKLELPIFLQTAAERTSVPVLDDDFLQRYPRITARALAGLLRQGTLVYHADELLFPHEKKAPEREILKWEDDRVKQSLKQAHTLLGTESLSLFG